MQKTKVQVKIKKREKKKIILDKGGEYVVELIGEGAEAEILGAFRLTGDEQMDVVVTVIHRAAHTSAETFIRAVVSGKARVGIRGKIIVEEGALGTHSFLRENVLLISPEAKAEAVPDLEIKTDEVQCSHAATIGKIDPEQVFYLESRGIAKKQAEGMIADGFLEPVRERMEKVPLLPRTSHNSRRARPFGSEPQDLGDDARDLKSLSRGSN